MDLTALGVDPLHLRQRPGSRSYGATRSNRSRPATARSSGWMMAWLQKLYGRRRLSALRPPPRSRRRRGVEMVRWVTAGPSYQASTDSGAAAAAASASSLTGCVSEVPPRPNGLVEPILWARPRHEQRRHARQRLRVRTVVVGGRRDHSKDARVCRPRSDTGAGLPRAESQSQAGRSVLSRANQERSRAINPSSGAQKQNRVNTRPRGSRRGVALTPGKSAVTACTSRGAANSLPVKPRPGYREWRNPDTCCGRSSFEQACAELCRGWR